MDFRILGSLEVVDGDRVIPLGAPKERAVLAILLLHANEVVSVDRVADELWDGQAPPSANKLVQNYVSQLRKSFGSPDSPLVSRRHGYELVVAPGELDAERFRKLLDEAREALASADPFRAGELLSAALAMWRGRPLAEVAYEPFAQEEIRRLEDLYAAALEEWGEVELALGRHDDVLPELRRLVEREPLRERARGLLMLALHRSGRQAEALEVYRDARRRLADELGLEPSSELRELERRILQGDESLAAPSRAPRAPLRPSAARRPLPLMALGAGGVLLVAAAAGAAGVLLTRGGGSASIVALASDSIGLVDPDSKRIVAAIRVGRLPSAIASGSDAVWVVNEQDSTVSRIDPRAHSVTRVVSVRGSPSDIAVTQHDVWVTSQFGSKGLLTRLDAETADIRSVSTLGAYSLVALAAGQDDLWIAAEQGKGTGGAILRLSLRTRRVQAISVPGKPVALAVGEESVWAVGFNPAGHGSPREGSVYRIDPQRNKVAAIGRAAFAPTHQPSIVAGHGAAWLSSDRRVVVALDPRTATVTRTVEVGGRAVALAVSRSAIFALTESGTLMRIEATRGRVTSSRRVVSLRAGNRALVPTALTVRAGGVWFAVGPDVRPSATVRAIRVGELEARPIRLSGPPGRVGFGFGSLWVKQVTSPGVSRVDPRTRRVIAQIGVGTGLGDIAFGHGSVWVSSFDRNTVSRIDPRTNRVIARINTRGLAPLGIATSSDRVWVANHHAAGAVRTGSVVSIDPSTNTVVKRISVGAPTYCCGPASITIVAGDVWVGVPNRGRVVRIDARTGKILARIPVPTGCGQFATENGRLWQADGCSNWLLRIDTKRDRVAQRIDTGGANVFPIAAADGTLWLTTDDSELLRFDPSANEVVRRINIAPTGRGGGYGGPYVTVAAGSLWLSDYDGGRLLQVDVPAARVSG